MWSSTIEKNSTLFEDESRGEDVSLNFEIFRESFEWSKKLAIRSSWCGEISWLVLFLESSMADEYTSKWHAGQKVQHAGFFRENMLFFSIRQNLRTLILCRTVILFISLELICLIKGKGQVLINMDQYSSFLQKNAKLQIIIIMWWKQKKTLNFFDHGILENRHWWNHLIIWPFIGFHPY